MVTDSKIWLLVRMNEGREPQTKGNHFFPHNIILGWKISYPKYYSFLTKGSKEKRHHGVSHISDDFVIKDKVSMDRRT